MDSNWTELELGGVINLKRGYDLPASKRKVGKIPIMSSSGINGYHNEEKVKGPGVITGRSGQLGKVFYIKDDYWPLNTTLYVEDFKNNYPKYVYYLLQTLEFEKFNAGSSVPTLNRNHVHKLKIKIPAYNIQKKIANILYMVDEKIQLNKEIVENLEEISQTLFKQWFIDFEFPNEEGKPYKSSGGEMVQSELGEIPKKWCSKKFNSIMKISSGKRPKIKADNYSLENSIPIIGASKLMGYTREMLFDSPILVIGRVGTHGIVQKIVDRCWPSDNTLVIQSEFYNFVYEFLKVIDYKSLNRGSTQPLITQTDIKNQTIIVPEDLTIMKKFEEILMPLLNKQFLLLKENESLTQLRDTLLPKLLSGEIEIPDELEV